MAPKPTELLKGTLDLLILRTLELDALHGVAIADRIAQVTQGTFVVKAGSLFPALHRLDRDGLIVGAWRVSDDGHRVRVYKLTAAGRRRLGVERRNWARISGAVNLMLQTD